MAEQNFQDQELPAFKEMEVEPEEDDPEEDDPEEDDPEEAEAEKTVPKEALPHNSPPSRNVAPKNSHASEDTAPQKSPSENAAPRNSPPHEDAAPRNSPPHEDAAPRNFPPPGDAAPRKSPPPGDAAPRKSPPPGDAAPRMSPPPGDAAPRKSPPPGDAAPQNSPLEEHVLENSRLSEESAGEQNDVDVETKRWPGWPGENVFRLVVPVQRVGGIIGRKGEYIKKICEETKARIKILDGPPGTQERTILISAKEEPELLVPPAVDGLLKIHKHIVETDTDPSNALIGGSGATCTRLLVAGSQAGSLIGKQGATVKSIQDDSHCSIRIIGEENVPVFALPDDSVVEIQGEPGGVQKAVELIATHLRKFLVDRSIIGVFETVMQSPNVRANQMTPHSQSWVQTPPAFAMNHGGHGYGLNHSSMAPRGRQFDNYRPPEISSLDKPPRGIPSYGRDFPAGANTNSLQPQQAVISKVTQNMQIPLSYADAIIGINGANISYIRRASGATIAIQETRGVPGEMTVEINGSSSQVQAAQQLIQNYIADAVSNAQNHPGPPVSQGYNPYQSHGPVYASAASNPPGQGYAPTRDYYGASYGY